MNCLVSVVIPSYGGGEFLARAVESVLSQTYKNIEVIVVDDNGKGTDHQIETEEKIAKYTNDSRFHYICHTVNKNGSAARNTGVKAAKGEYIALLDDDDVFYVDNIENHMKVWNGISTEYALTYCSREMYRGDQLIDRNHVSRSGYLLYEVLMHDVTIGSSSLVIRKQVWEELGGFDESFRRHQDWEFTARVAAKYKVKAADHVGFKRYLEFRNSPKSPETVIKYREHYLEKMAPLIATLPIEKQRDVLVKNRMDAAVQFLKKKDIKGFLKEWKRIKPGIRGFKHIIYVIKARHARGKIDG